VSIARHNKKFIFCFVIFLSSSREQKELFVAGGGKFLNFTFDTCNLGIKLYIFIARESWGKVK
jgi:hypothetical protein